MRFTRHATRQIFDRTAIDRRQVKELIDGRFCVILGEEQGTNKRHYLFYSELDRDCFVAVVDEEDKEYITILPVSYHNRWKIDPEMELIAEDLALNREKSRFFKIEIQLSEFNVKKIPVFCYVFRDGKFMGPFGLGKFSNLRLAKLESSEYHTRPEIVADLLVKIKTSGIAESDIIESIVWVVNDERHQANPDIISKHINSRE